MVSVTVGTRLDERLDPAPAAHELLEVRQVLARSPAARRPLRRRPRRRNHAHRRLLPVRPSDAAPRVRRCDRGVPSCPWAPRVAASARRVTRWPRIVGPAVHPRRPWCAPRRQPARSARTAATTTSGVRRERDHQPRRRHPRRRQRRLRGRAARRQLGLSVALIEKDKLGGTCLHRGCIPTKALLHAGEVADQTREAEQFGVKADAQRRRHQGRQRVQGRRRRQAVQGPAGPGQGAQDHLRRGRRAGWSAPNAVEVDGTRYTGRNVVLATGSYSKTPARPGDRRRAGDHQRARAHAGPRARRRRSCSAAA